MCALVSEGCTCTGWCVRAGGAVGEAARAREGAGWDVTVEYNAQHSLARPDWNEAVAVVLPLKLSCESNGSCLSTQNRMIPSHKQRPRADRSETGAAETTDLTAAELARLQRHTLQHPSPVAYIPLYYWAAACRASEPQTHSSTSTAVAPSTVPATASSQPLLVQQAAPNQC
jgi:hypothetical protein